MRPLYWSSVAWMAFFGFAVVASYAVIASRATDVPYVKVLMISTPVAILTTMALFRVFVDGGPPEEES